MRTALVLAAGSARRFGSDKLLAPLEGRPLLSHALAIARAAPVERVVCVVRPSLREALPDVGDVRWVDLASDGLAASLRTGLAKARALGAEAVFVFLGDMPWVPASMAADLLAAEAANAGQVIAAHPVHKGRPGHPVLLTRAAMALADGLEGDAGLGPLLRDRADVLRLESDDPGVCRDVDRPEDLPQA